MQKYISRERESGGGWGGAAPPSLQSAVCEPKGGRFTAGLHSCLALGGGGGGSIGCGALREHSDVGRPPPPPRREGWRWEPPRPPPVVGLILIQTKNPSGNQRGGLSVGSGDPRSPQKPPLCANLGTMQPRGGAEPHSTALGMRRGGGGLHPDPPTAPSCPEQGEEGRYCLAAGRGGGGGREEGTARPRGGGGGGEGRHGGE